MTTVAMDANALMMPVELDVRVFDELDRLLPAVEFVTPRAVRDELDALADGSGTEAAAASVGRDLADEHTTIVDHDEPYADDALVELARDGDVDYVVTNDIPLRDRILALSVPVIGLRGRNKLTVKQP